MILLKCAFFFNVSNQFWMKFENVENTIVCFDLLVYDMMNYILVWINMNIMVFIKIVTAKNLNYIHIGINLLAIIIVAWWNDILWLHKDKDILSAMVTSWNFQIPCNLPSAMDRFAMKCKTKC